MTTFLVSHINAPFDISPAKLRKRRTTLRKRKEREREKEYERRRWEQRVAYMEAAREMREKAKSSWIGRLEAWLIG